MTNLQKATKIFALLSALFFANFAHGQTPGAVNTIPMGTRIRLRMDNEINSKVSSVGDTFTAVVAEPVLIREIEFLAVGTVIEGKITRVKKAASGRSDGSLEVKFETLYLPKEIKLRIDGGLVKTEKRKSSRASNALKIAGATGIGALIGTLLEKTKGALVGASLGLGIGASAVLLQKGEEARIRAGEEFEIILNADVKLPPEDF